MKFFKLKKIHCIRRIKNVLIIPLLTIFVFKIDMSLGKLIRNGRETRKISRQKFAELIGANINSISKYEKAGEDGGQYPPFPVLAKITHVLELSPVMVLSEGLESNKEREEMQRNTRELFMSMAKLYFTTAELISGLEIDLAIAQDNLRVLIGSPENLPEDMRDKFIGDSIFDIFPEENIKKENDPGENP